MKKNIKIDMNYTVDIMKKLINTPSTVSYYDQINPLIKKLAKEIGYSVTYDNKHTAYITVEGVDNNKTVGVGAHLDTIGLCVKSINSNGRIKVVSLGGISYSSIEGETVTIHTRDGKSYTGLMICNSHSVHVFDDAMTLTRDANSMVIALDENVNSKEDVEKLGILPGDPVSICPNFELTDNGYIKSRFIDDKAGVAVIFGVLKTLKDKKIKPQNKTIFAFPHYEEVGHGGSFIPKEIEEFVAIDIGLIGPELNGSEYKVSICTKDAFSPYDRALSSRLIDIAKKESLDYAVDIFYRYGTDANAAIRAGNNIPTAAFGMGTLCSHGRERTNIKSIENTGKLLLGYILE